MGNRDSTIKHPTMGLDIGYVTESSDLSDTENSADDSGYSYADFYGDEGSTDDEEVGLDVAETLWDSNQRCDSALAVR